MSSDDDMTCSVQTESSATVTFVKNSGFNAGYKGGCAALAADTADGGTLRACVLGILLRKSQALPTCLVPAAICGLRGRSGEAGSAAGLWGCRVFRCYLGLCVLLDGVVQTSLL